MTLLVKVIHGSRLYGLDGPDSDIDYKGVYLPKIEDCLMLEARPTFLHKENEEANTEYEFFSLQKFLKLACNGESIVIDMLHCSNCHIVETNTAAFLNLQKNKHRFYTKRMVGAVSYAKNMALKYGFRADRLNALQKVLDFLIIAGEKGVGKLYQCWDDLPSGEHIERGIDDRNNNIDKRYYEVAGKKLQTTISIEYAIEIIHSAIDRFGDRVTAAAKLDGADYKAISHSYRVAYQLYNIYKYGGFCYPLIETPFLRDLKFGKLNFIEDSLDKKLNDLVSEVEQLALNSSFPEKVDQEYIRQFVISQYNLW